MGLNIILSILGVLFVLEAVVVLLFSKGITKWTIKLMKDQKRLKRWALGELVIGIILVLVSILMKSN